MPLGSVMFSLTLVRGQQGHAAQITNTDSNHKNALFKRWLGTHNTEDKKKCKNYLKLFQAVTSATQSVHYRDKFEIQINTSKQSLNNWRDSWRRQ